MDIFRPLASVLASSCSSSSPSLKSLIASRLSEAPNDEKPALCRLLAELLRSQSNADGDDDALNVLHTYVRTLVSAGRLEDVSADFKLAVELADDRLLVQILDETTESVDSLLQRATDVHITSDEAFAVEFAGFLEKYRGTIKTTADKKDTEEETEEQYGLGGGLTVLHETAVRQLRFWHFLFILGERRPESANNELYRRIADVLPARLLAVMALRDFGLAQAASNALCCLVNGFHQFQSAGSSEVAIHLSYFSFFSLPSLIPRV